jgi:hypothetical protein
LQVVVIGVELANELIELEGGLPDLEKEVASRAAAAYGALAIDRGVISSVPGATAVELSGSDLQTSSRPYTVAGNSAL